ncbi:MAG: DUF4115 domain-containing protein, partial [Gammaproteobacteria bacterium]|nr:DUF4115 domain-containing protein [Gammaproteobacteria bacterium]
GAAASAVVPARITTAAPAVAASAAPAGGQLVLQFDQTSWVRIEDAGGQLLLSGLIRAGERRVLQGTPPYSVFLGNAPGVQLRYAGRTIDIGTYTRADATARLTVP